MIRAVLALALATLVAYLGLLGLPGPADAQQPASPRRIGIVLGGFLPEGKEAQQFRQGLREAGYAEGRDVVIEWRPTSGDYSRIPQLVADLLQRSGLARQAMGLMHREQPKVSEEGIRPVLMIA